VSGRGLVCFDLDGCLVDSVRAIGDSLSHALRTIGLEPLTPDEVRPFIGPPLVDTLRTRLEAVGADTWTASGAARLAAAVTAYRTRYASEGFRLTTVIPGVVQALRDVAAERGKDRIVVVTAKPQAVAEPLLDHVGLRGLLGAVHGVGMGLGVEPKHVTLARALAEHDVAAGDAVMVGDREHDVLAGRACGTATVGVLWGAGPREELMAAGADAIVEAPAALPGAIGAISRGWSAGR
jgi:phosphoglycolate phosphatase